METFSCQNYNGAHKNIPIQIYHHDLEDQEGQEDFLIYHLKVFPSFESKVFKMQLSPLVSIFHLWKYL